MNDKHYDRDSSLDENQLDDKENHLDDNSQNPKSPGVDSNDDTVEIENSLNSLSDSDGQKKKRNHTIDQETYEQVLKYKMDTKIFDNDKCLKKKIQKLSYKFDYLLKGSEDAAWPNGPVLYKVLLNTKGKRLKSKLFVPPIHVNRTIKHFHEEGANKHQGWTRTFKLLNEKHSGISEHEVREYCNKCDVCTQFVMVSKKPRLKPILSTGVFNRVQIDIKDFTFYEADNDGYAYQLTIIDHFSCYPWAIPQFTKKSKEVAYNLLKLFYMFGFPEIIQSDNGGEFVRYNKGYG